MRKYKKYNLRALFIIGLVALASFYVFPIKDKINLGLDLKGGMYLLLKVDTSNLPKNKIADAAERAIEVIRNRIDQFGVKEPLIQIEGKDTLLVQLPGEVDRERALKLIGRTAFLEFKLVEDNPQKLKEALAGNVPSGYELKKYNNVPLLLAKKADVTGADLADAQTGFDNMMAPVVKIRFNAKGAKKFGQVTQNNVGRRLAIVLDGKVISAPNIREPILTGEGEITGHFSVDEASDLALALRAGALPAPIIVQEERTVGPLLGSDSIKRGVNSILLGALLVVLFMLVYYLAGGIVAVICLVLDLLFILAGLSAFKATLTLPGIAGMILTIGMAVDANVLIFERTREELDNKRPLSLALAAGFDKAKRTIFDANITTLIAAFFLFVYGTGPIKGFAATLSLGLAVSMFTAIFVGRTIFEFLLRMKMKTFKMMRIFTHPKINFVGIRNICLFISLSLVAFSIFSFISKGKSAYGIDFTGGQVLEYKLTPSPDIAKLREIFAQNGLKKVILQEFKDFKGAIIIKSNADITAQADKILKANFKKVQQLKVTHIGPAVGRILKQKALLAIFLSLIGMLIYVAFRFRHWDFAFAAIIALFHDVLISLGIAVFFGYKINLLMVTALLTIAGYSINDTIVVYDRIRELIPRMHKLKLPDIINSAINQTISRTIITSFTTIIVVASIFVLGGGSLKGFSFTLLVGFIVGTYSSIYIASPMVLFFHKNRRV